jgi:hypothetical protein
MKKKVSPLKLGRETLLALNAPALAVPRGAGAVGIEPISQEGESCLQSCYFNTCYDTCDWTNAAGLAAAPAAARR